VERGKVRIDVLAIVRFLSVSFFPSGSFRLLQGFNVRLGW